jgi:hypothetical protein
MIYGFFSKLFFSMYNILKSVTYVIIKIMERWKTGGTLELKEENAGR